MLRNAKRKKHSLIQRLITMLSLLIGVLVIVLLATYLYSLRIVQTNTVNLSQNAVSIYVNDMNNSLINMSRTLDELAFNTIKLSDLSSTEETQRYFISVNLLNILNAKINYGTDADAYFIKNTGSSLVLTSFSNRISGISTAQVNDYLRKHNLFSAMPQQNHWAPVAIAGSWYYLKYYCIDGNDIGVLVSTDTLMSYVRQTAGEYGNYVLTDGQGRCLSAVGTQTKKMSLGSEKPGNKEKVAVLTDRNELIVTGTVNQCEARVSNLIPRSNVLQGFTVIQWSLILMVLLCLCLVIGILAFANREILSPVVRLIRAIWEVQSGNLDRQVNYSANTREMNLLKKSFNHMMRQIKVLKIRSYEEKISRQKAELKYLQMQIRPHFYLNALTTIHSMTYQNKNEQIRSFIEALSNHLRYTIRDGVTQVTLAEEIRHIEDYIRMQEIRFPDSVLFVADIVPEVKECLIPQFLLLTFVENAFKYAMSLDTTLSLMLQGRKTKKNGRPVLALVLEDNGKGFPEDVIQRINAPIVKQINPDGRQIGLYNVKKTLSLFYGKEGGMVLSNCLPSGAHVEITIPLGKE